MQFPPWGFGSILGDEKMNVLEQHAIKIYFGIKQKGREIDRKEIERYDIENKNPWKGSKKFCLFW